MNDQTSGALALSTASEGRLALRPTDQDVFARSRFEEVERTAKILADSLLLPLSISHYKTGEGRDAKDIPHPPEVVFARAVLIANQAQHWGADALLVAQCSSIVHNRLMFEGKLVHAVVEKLVGIRLRYEFGVWNKDHFEPVDDEKKLWGAGEALAVRVIGKFADEDIPRSVEGSVGIWKTSQWTIGAWRQRLCYRGAREWARAHSPGVILGILADDEFEDAYDAAQGRRLASDPATPLRLTSEFEDGPARDEAKLDLQPTRDDPKPEGPKNTRAPRRQAIVPAAGNSADADKPAPQADASAPSGSASVENDLGGDDLPDALKERPTGTVSAPAADASPASSDTATDASGTSAAGASGPSAPAADERPLEDGPAEDDDGQLETPAGEPVVVISEGYPPADAPYFLNGDNWFFDRRDDKWKRESFKNGEPFSTVGDQAAYATYEEHAPEGGPAAADIPADEQGGEDDSEAVIDRFIDEVEAATSWAQIKKAFAWFFQSDAWAGLKADEQNAFRVKTWEFASKLPDVEDQAQSPTAFRLWIETQSDPDVIRGTLPILERGGAFQKMQPSQQDAIRRAAAGRIEALTT